MNRDILPERTWGAVNSQVPSKVFCGEGPQLAWGEESAKRSGRVCAVPQGESVLDASMMADLIVSKKGDRVPAQTSPPQPRAPGRKAPAWWSTVAVGGKTWKRALPAWFIVWGALVVRVFAASIGTPVEGKIGTYTAEWTLENQGHPHDRQKPERCQRSGRAGLDRALVAAEGGSRLPSCDAAPRGGCRPDGRGVAGCPRRMGRARQQHHRWLGRGESLFPAQKRLLLLLLLFRK